MEKKKIRVSVADYKIAFGGCFLVSYGLGSCVGVALFQPGMPVAGLAHILLPRRGEASLSENLLKFADVALALMRSDLIEHGISPQGLRSKIAGGASMFFSTSEENEQSVGQRNVKAVLEVLNDLSIPVLGQDTGGNFGRTIQFDPQRSELSVRSLRGGSRIV